jgi:hypothetical protein
MRLWLAPPRIHMLAYCPLFLDVTLSFSVDLEALEGTYEP